MAAVCSPCTQSALAEYLDRIQPCRKSYYFPEVVPANESVEFGPVCMWHQMSWYVMQGEDPYLTGGVMETELGKPINLIEERSC